jgi:hypothetical protein
MSLNYTKPLDERDTFTIDGILIAIPRGTEIKKWKFATATVDKYFELKAVEETVKKETSKNIAIT